MNKILAMLFGVAIASMVFGTALFYPEMQKKEYASKLEVAVKKHTPGGSTTTVSINTQKKIVVSFQTTSNDLSKETLVDFYDLTEFFRTTSCQGLKNILKAEKLDNPYPIYYEGVVVGRDNTIFSYSCVVE